MTCSERRWLFQSAGSVSRGQRQVEWSRGAKRTSWVEERSLSIGMTENDDDSAKVSVISVLSLSLSSLLPLSLDFWNPLRECRT